MRSLHGLSSTTTTQSKVSRAELSENGICLPSQDPFQPSQEAAMMGELSF